MTPSATAAALAVLAEAPSALISDVDGTLSRIVPRPEGAVVEPALSAALDRLRRRIHLVAVISARPGEVAARMVGVDGIEYVGHYGLTAESDGVGIGGVVTLRARAADGLRAFPCATLEDKGISFALHYRNCDDPEAAREGLLALLEPLTAASGARLVEGKRVIEVVPAKLPDKAHALASLEARHSPRGIVYLGDDLGDVAVFLALARRREERGLPSLGIAVVDRETDARVLQAADVTVEGVDGVRELLEALAASPALGPEKGND